MTDLNPELIAKAADVIDVRCHDFRFDTDTWRPYCICGWSAEESHDVAPYDRHIAVAVLEAVADDLRAEALENAADDYQTGGWADDLPTGTTRPALILGMSQRAVGWLRARAAELRGADK